MMLRIFIAKSSFFIPIILMMISAVSPLRADIGEQTFSIAALTWNIGNTTTSDDVVQDFVNDLKIHNLPDIIVIGTQEELARSDEKLKDKLLSQLNHLKPGSYTLAAENSYGTAAGINNSVKTALLVGVQKSPASKALNLPQNRTSLAILIKDGNSLKDVTTKIYYPSDKKANNAFILIKGNLNKKDGSRLYPLPISISNVHLNSFSDAKRREHTNLFLEGEGLSTTNKKYADILNEAKRFHLVMGDFNERDYLMKDSSIVDRGYLTNLPAYGFDFAQPQEKSKVVYGTYGFTKLGNTLPESLKDPRARLHNAKGGFLDRITITSGQSIHAQPKEYGAVIDKAKFDTKKKLFYAGSDHLPIIRYIHIFTMGEQNNAKLVKEHIKQRLPNFEKEIKNIDLVMENKANTNKVIFYDSAEYAERFWQKLSHQDLDQKKKDLLFLQEKIKDLKGRIDKSTDNSFLEKVYTKITFCNKKRMETLEKMSGDGSSKIKWYVADSLGQDDFKNYTYTFNELVPSNSQKSPTHSVRSFN